MIGWLEQFRMILLYKPSSDHRMGATGGEELLMNHWPATSYPPCGNEKRFLECHAGKVREKKT